MPDARILIVEDEMITALDEKATLEEMGYEVVGIADSGERAITLAAEMKPDLVIMDITLKTEMSGLDAAWSIREQFNVPVIFVTAQGDKGAYEASTTDLVTGYLIKPFDPKILKENVEAALRGELSPPRDWKPMSERF